MMVRYAALTHPTCISNVAPATGVPTPVRAASPRVRRTTEDFEKAQPSVSWAFYFDTVKQGRFWINPYEKLN